MGRMRACHLASDGQEHKLIQHAGPEQYAILQLHATACRERGCHRYDGRFIGWV